MTSAVHPIAIEAIVGITEPMSADPIVGMTQPLPVHPRVRPHAGIT
jgi:hypothetical protein